MGLLRKSGVVFVGRALPALIGVGGVAIYTRLLDPTSVGEYALLLSMSLLAAAIAFSWLRVAALRLSSGTVDESHGPLLLTVILSFAGTSILVVAVQCAVLRVLQPQLALSSVGLAALAAVASGWFDLNLTMLQARLSVFTWSMLNFARAAAALLSSLLLILAGWRTDALLAGFVIGNCMTFAFSRIWLPARGARFDRSTFRRLFLFGWPSSATAALMQLSPTFQRYTLDGAAGSAAVGLFSVAQDFTSQTLFSIIGAISLAGIPMAYKAKDEGGAAGLNRQLLDNARLNFAVAVPATVGLAVLAGPIAHFLFGARFRAGADVIIAIVAASTFIAALRVYYFDQSFELALDTKPQAVNAVIGIGLLIGLCVVLIPRFGAVGASLSSLASSSLWLVLSIVWGRRVLAMPIPVRSWCKTLLAVAGMALSILAVPDRNSVVGLAISVIFGGLAYATISVLLRFELFRTQVSHRFAWFQR